MSSRWHPVSLFDADPDLVAGVPEADRAIARRTLIVPAVGLDTGLWSPPDDLAFALLIGLILLAGVLSREIGFAGRGSAGPPGAGASSSAPATSCARGTRTARAASRPRRGASTRPCGSRCSTPAS